MPTIEDSLLCFAIEIAGAKPTNEDEASEFLEKTIDKYANEIKTNILSVSFN